MPKHRIGLCRDCVHEREPFAGSFLENMACPYRKADGGCWAAPPEWRSVACGHAFCADVTEQLTEWIGYFGVEDRADRAYYLDIHDDGTVQLCDSTDGSAGIVFDLPDFRYCPLCGTKYRKEEDHDS